jgi:Protein of unknown function (DUF3570)
MRDRRPQNRAARRRGKHRGRSLRQRKGVLAALTASALLLPGLAKAQEERWSVDYAYSLYSEGKLDSSKLNAGSADRYEIDTHQLSLRGPITGRMDLGIDLVHETMSGATPWYIEQDANGDAVVAMTEASVEDQRTDFLGRGTYYFDTSRLKLSSGYSTEDDYSAINFGFGTEHDFNEKNTTLSWGFGTSLDTIDPTPTDENLNPSQEDKRTIGVFAGWSQVINRSSAFQALFSFQNGSGFLSDPYKLVSDEAASDLVPDSRPDSRNQYSLMTRYRRHFSSITGTLHLDYRFYFDDWDINSHTVELAWYQPLFEVVTIVPSVRYYTQSQASFYVPYATTALDLTNYEASSDYRLSPYGALSGKLRIETRISDWPFHMAWKLGASYERYEASGSLAVSSVDLENPALVSFDVIMLNLSARF